MELENVNKNSQIEMEANKSVVRKIIVAISIVLVLIWLYRFAIGSSWILNIMFLNVENIGLELASTIIPLVAMPVAILLFWRETKLGWILISFFSTYTIGIGLF